MKIDDRQVPAAAIGVRKRVGVALSTATSLDAIACVRNGLHEAAAIGLVEPAEAAQADALHAALVLEPEELQVWTR